MSLATRCPACSTTFRVVQDQLKVSDGWVRCGQCQEVFNALETLFELPPAPVTPIVSRPEVSGTPPRSTPDPFTDIDLGESSAASTHAIAEVDPPNGAPPPPREGNPAVDAVPGIARGVADDPAQADAAEEIRHPPLSPPAAADGSKAPVDVPAEETIRSSAQSVEDATPPDSTANLVAESLPDPTLAVPAAPTAPGANSDPGLIQDGDETPPDDLLLLTPAGPAPHAAAADPPRPMASTTADPGNAPPGAGLATPEDATVPEVPAWTMSPEVRWERKRRRRPRPEATAPAGPSAGTSASAEATASAPRSRRPKPEFMRRVERAAHWQRPAVRAVLGSAAAVLLLLLCGQFGLAYRDELAVRWPVLAAPLAQACRPLGCDVAAPRSLEHLVIDSSQLSRTAWPDTLRLTAELRNTASHAVRAPALELRFTDPSGRTLVRKVLLPAELTASAAAAPLAIAADDSWQIDALLAVGPLKVSGFSAEVFYP